MLFMSVFIISFEAPMNEIVRLAAAPAGDLPVDLDTNIPKSREFTCGTVHFNDCGALMVANLIARTAEYAPRMPVRARRGVEVGVEAIAALRRDQGDRARCARKCGLDIVAEVS